MKPALSSPPVLTTDFDFPLTVIEGGPLRFFPRSDGTWEILAVRGIESAAIGCAEFHAAFKHFDLTILRQEKHKLLGTNFQIWVHHYPKIVLLYSPPLSATSMNIVLTRFHKQFEDFLCEVSRFEIGNAHFNLWKAKCIQNPRWVAFYEEE